MHLFPGAFCEMKLAKVYFSLLIPQLDPCRNPVWLGSIWPGTELEFLLL